MAITKRSKDLEGLTMQDLLDMEVGDAVTIAPHRVTRCPSGWIYYCNHGQTFVPEPIEYLGDETYFRTSQFEEIGDGGELTIDGYDRQ